MKVLLISAGFHVDRVSREGGKATICQNKRGLEFSKENVHRDWHFSDTYKTMFFFILFQGALQGCIGSGSVSWLQL